MCPEVSRETFICLPKCSLKEGFGELFVEQFLFEDGEHWARGLCVFEDADDRAKAQQAEHDDRAEDTCLPCMMGFLLKRNCREDTTEKHDVDCAYLEQQQIPGV